MRRKLGEHLVAEGQLTSEQLARALELQKHSGCMLGQVLMGEGYVSALQLARAVAAQLNLPCIDTVQEPPDTTLLHMDERTTYFRLQCLPWRREGEVVVILTPYVNSELLVWAAQRYGVDGYKLAVTSKFDVLWCLHHVFGWREDEQARLALWLAMPHASARDLAFHRHPEIVIAVFLLLAAVLWWAGDVMALVAVFVLNATFLCALLFKALLVVAARGPGMKRPPALSDARLPLYTVLVPLYREAESVPRLLKALRGLDYPKSKLDVKLIVEADDDATTQAIKAAGPESWMEIIRVPDSQPRTKPKACNYALSFARGELVTIYDAEDHPHPQQLRKAAAIFAASPKTACVQGRLNYYNRPERLITKLFAIEYAVWFEFLLKGLDRLRLPMPLGGTSNHLRLSALRAAHGWDPYNVTEDADLGMRLAMMGLTTRVLDSLTLEEAPNSLVLWFRQRVRWIKGYMQTYLVYMRSPFRLWRMMGTNGFIAFQLFIGGPTVIFLSTPLLWGLMAYWAISGSITGNPGLDRTLAVVAVINVALANLEHWVFAALAVLKRQWKGMFWAVLLTPWYWLLHSAASLIAVVELFFRPFHWHKTPHRRSRMSADAMHRVMAEEFAKE